MDHISLKNSITLPWLMTSISSAFRPTWHIVSSCWMLESLDLWEMPSRVAAMRSSKKLERRYQYRILLRSIGRHVPMHSNPRPFKRPSRIVEFILSTQASSLMRIMHQVIQLWHKLTHLHLIQSCQPHSWHLTTKAMMFQRTTTWTTLMNLIAMTQMTQMMKNVQGRVPLLRCQSQLKWLSHPSQNVSKTIAHLPLPCPSQPLTFRQHPFSAQAINNHKMWCISTRIGQRGGNLRLQQLTGISFLKKMPGSGNNWTPLPHTVPWRWRKLVIWNGSWTRKRTGSPSWQWWTWVHAGSPVGMVWCNLMPILQCRRRRNKRKRRWSWCEKRLQLSGSEREKLGDQRMSSKGCCHQCRRTTSRTLQPCLSYHSRMPMASSFQQKSWWQISRHILRPTPRKRLGLDSVAFLQVVVGNYDPMVGWKLLSLSNLMKKRTCACCNLSPFHHSHHSLHMSITLQVHQHREPLAQCLTLSACLLTRINSHKHHSLCILYPALRSTCRHLVFNLTPLYIICYPPKIITYNLLINLQALLVHRFFTQTKSTVYNSYYSCPIQSYNPHSRTSAPCRDWIFTWSNSLLAWHKCDEICKTRWLSSFALAPHLTTSIKYEKSILLKPETRPLHW